MKSLPKYRDERIRLKAHLEKQKQLIHDDMEEIKTALKPISVAKQVISEAANSFRDNSFATQTTRLALTVLPKRIRHPLVGIAAQIAVPMLMRNVPLILHLIKGIKGGTNGQPNSLVDQLPSRAGVLSGLRKAVTKLRHKIKPELDTPF